MYNKIEDILFDKFEENDIELNYEGNGEFIFTSIESLDKAEEIIKKVVGNNYNRDDSLFTIQIFENDSVLFNYLLEELKEKFLNNEISKEEYKENLIKYRKELEETYDKEELQDLIGKTFNQQKILSIYRRTKYNDSRLFAHTKCKNCGREKRVFVSNLIKDPDKYGSCVCSNKNIESRLDTINALYDGSKKLSSNTSGYTGVSFVRTYNGELYNKWRAYIEIDGKRTYLGDFDSKSKAIKARKAAALKGLKWYKEHKNQFMKDTRKKAKTYRSNSK